MKFDIQKKFSIFALLSAFALVFLFTPALTSAQTGALSPFGGQILAMKPCLNFATGSFHITLGPPKGGSFIYQVGISLSYLNGPPTHPGQWLLGMSAPGPRCATDIDDGDFTGWRTGGLIIFHGSSL